MKPHYFTIEIFIAADDSSPIDRLLLYRLAFLERELPLEVFNLSNLFLSLGILRSVFNCHIDPRIYSNMYLADCQEGKHLEAVVTKTTRHKGIWLSGYTDKVVLEKQYPFLSMEEIIEGEEIDFTAHKVEK